MSKIILLALFSIGLHSTFSQSTNICTMSSETQEQIKQRMLSNRLAFKNNIEKRSGGSIYIPVRIWLTAKNDSTGRFQDYLALFNFFCHTNECISDHSIIFYIKDIDESINDTLIYEYPNTLGSKLLDKITKSNHDAINIFFVNEPSTGVLGNYSLTYDYLTFNNLGVVDSTRALCHLLGHYFSLVHTCYPWSSYDCNLSTINQIPFGKPVEYVSRTKEDSNGIVICSYVADGFCDTPADYGEFMHSSITPCEYNGCAKDPDGVKLNPTISNPMSISSYIITCFDTFTNEQNQAMLLDYLSAKRDYIKVNYNPLGFTGTPKYLLPTNKQKLTTNDSIFFDWKDDPNSTEYILEISEDISFEYKVQRFRTKESQYLVTNLQAHSPYYWRVLAYNPNSFCDIKPAVATFTTGALRTSTNNKELQKQYKINDYLGSDKIVIEFLLDSYEPVQYRLFDLSGRSLEIKAAKDNFVEINKNELGSGVYFLRALYIDKNPLIIKLLVQ